VAASPRPNCPEGAVSLTAQVQLIITASRRTSRRPGAGPPYLITYSQPSRLHTIRNPLYPFTPLPLYPFTPSTPGHRATGPPGHRAGIPIAVLQFPGTKFHSRITPVNDPIFRS